MSFFAAARACNSDAKRRSVACKSRFVKVEHPKTGDAEDTAELKPGDGVRLDLELGRFSRPGVSIGLHLSCIEKRHRRLQDSPGGRVIVLGVVLLFSGGCHAAGRCERSASENVVPDVRLSQ